MHRKPAKDRSQLLMNFLGTSGIFTPHDFIPNRWWDTKKKTSTNSTFDKKGKDDSVNAWYRICHTFIWVSRNQHSQQLESEVGNINLWLLDCDLKPASSIRWTNVGKITLATTIPEVSLAKHRWLMAGPPKVACAQQFYKLIAISRRGYL